jgi:hypothetical protein
VGATSAAEALAVTGSLFAPDIVDISRELGRPDAPAVSYGFVPLIDMVDVVRELGRPEANAAAAITGPLFAPDIVDVQRELGRSDGQ